MKLSPKEVTFWFEPAGVAWLYVVMAKLKNTPLTPIAMSALPAPMWTSSVKRSTP